MSQQDKASFLQNGAPQGVKTLLDNFKVRNSKSDIAQLKKKVTELKFRFFVFFLGTAYKMFHFLHLSGGWYLLTPLKNLLYAINLD